MLGTYDELCTPSIDYYKELTFASTWALLQFFSGIRVAHLPLICVVFLFLSLFLFFLLVLCHVPNLMLPVSLGCPFLFDFSVFSNLY